MHRSAGGLLLFVALTLVACGGDATTSSDHADQRGEIVTPPFEVRGAADDLVLTWYDEDGPHVATSRAEVPAEHRAEVRVDSLDVAPDDRDPDSVWVADLRSADEHGDYTVRRLSRATFEEHVTTLVAAAHAEPAGSGTGDVIIYGAEWCGACHDAQAFLRARGIPFVERDIERDPGAREDMQRAAAAAGIPTGSIPIIDFRGTIIRGFDRDAIERAIRETSPDQAPGITI
jgi:glutaredoxin